jgi:5-methylcytosine-specific restriction protein A
MKAHADAYRRDDPDRRFLQSREWRERIRPRQLHLEPLCRFCRALGHVEIAEHVDHVRRPQGDKHLQRDPDNFQSLCVPHHMSKSKWERGDTSKPLVIGRTQDGWETVVAVGGTIKVETLADDQPMRTRKNPKP